jgi:two-component system, NarL family, invasion response regulator UvrY
MPGGGMIHILVADDHAVVRQGVKQILADDCDDVVIGEASNIHEVLDLVRQQKWDIVILDMTMPGRSGLDALKDLKQLHPKLPVLVLSMHPEDQFAVRVLKAGAAGYLTKESAAEELVSAIQKVLQGGKYVSASLAEVLATSLSDDLGALPHLTLSDREYQILSLIASGKTVRSIAQELSLGVSTISTYRSRILQKLKMKNNAELTRYAFQHQLVP